MVKVAARASRFETILVPAVTEALTATPVRPQRLAVPDIMRLSATVNWPLLDPQPEVVFA